LGSEKVICLPNTDTALIVRCQERDPAAFDEIVTRYKQKIFNYVYRMIGNGDEAEDVTQDVFVKMYVSLPSFRSEASITTWLFKIAGNLCIDRYRKRSRREQAMGGETISLDYRSEAEPSGAGGGPTVEVPDRDTEPQRILEQAELDRQIQAALAELPDKMRAVVLLHDIEGLSYEEIAQIERCPLGTIKSRLFNARQQLRKLLTPYLQS
jgi:RNA polymerase sigma-70 factor (ECF subfamily)